MSSAAAALQMLERRQQVLANNLANAATRGFKAETAFSRIMGDALASTDTALDLSPGTLTETHNTLDLAIEGDGFFVTETPDGERFVRNGSFRLDTERRLVDERGHAVLGDNGPVVLPPGVVEIDATGMVKVNGRTVQRLRVERVANGADLQHEGGTQFVPDATQDRDSPGAAQRAPGVRGGVERERDERDDRDAGSAASLRRRTEDVVHHRRGARHCRDRPRQARLTGTSQWIQHFAPPRPA